MINLAFGARRVSLHGTPHMSVDELLHTAGALAELDPSLLLLVSGEFTLHRGTFLRDYITAIGPAGMYILVTYQSRLTTPVTPPTGPILPPSDPTYSILVLFETLPSMEPVVTASMEVRRLRQLVASWSGVPTDTVHLQFAGSVLDMDRRLSDAPAIRSGAHVHAFFSIARALQFVMHLMQGGNPPPPATPLPTQVFGPILPPGYVHTNNSPLPQSQSPSQPPANQHPSSRGLGMVTRTTASERLRSSFKCPKFLGETRHWKVWNQGFVRFLSINHLDHIIEEDFLKAHMTTELQDDNKLVYYILEESVAGSPTASKYVRRAAMWNGNEAYYMLYSGFALSGPATAAILLVELGNFRFKPDETPSEVVLRLQELFDDLESLPGTAALLLNDTQKINYLLSAVRPERSLASVYAQIQTEQVRGTITFAQACVELQYRDEAIRADDLLHAAHLPTKVRGLVAEPVKPAALADKVSTALITTADKRQNKVGTTKAEPTSCMAKSCDVLTPPRMRLCKTCYHECIAGKTPTVWLKTGDKATFDPATQRIVFPPSASDSTKTSRKVKAAVSFLPVPSDSAE
jgi:hypothetical protein